MRPLAARALANARRLLRVGAYLLTVAVVLAVAFVARARAAMGGAALALGGELAQLPVATGPANRVRLNGERVLVASAMVDDEPRAVLDRFEGECRAHGGGLAEELERLAQGAAGAGAKPGLLPSVGVIRADGEGRGVVACLAHQGTDGSAAFLRGLRAMLATGDLAELGALRYVLAERAPGAAKTHVLAAWTEGSCRLGALFPKGEGDAPGSDPEGAPRPAAARRLLTASLEGVPYGVRVYDAAGPAADVLAGYDRAMPASGWSPIAGVAPGLERVGRPGRAFTREGVELLVFADPHRGDAGRAVVSVIELPPPSGDRR